MNTSELNQLEALLVKALGERQYGLSHSVAAILTVIPELIADSCERIAMGNKFRNLEADLARLQRCDHKFINSNSCIKCGWTPS